MIAAIKDFLGRIASYLAAFGAGWFTGKNYEEKKELKRDAEQAKTDAANWANRPSSDDAVLKRLRDAALRKDRS